MADSSTALKALLDSMSDGVCILEGAGLVVAVNRRLAELLDFPPGFLRPGDPAKKLSDHMRRVAGIGLEAVGEPAKPFRHEAQRAGGPVLDRPLHRSDTNAKRGPIIRSGRVITSGMSVRQPYFIISIFLTCVKCGPCI